MSDETQENTTPETAEAAPVPEAASAPAPAPPPPPTPPAPAAAAPAAPAQQKNPMAAAFLATMPGLGHVYNGLYQRGIVFFVLFFGAISLAAESNVLFFAFCIPFIWLFNVLDAYRQANLINHGYATDLGLADAPKAGTPGQGGFVVGIILVIVGALELLERFNFWDWDWLWEAWPALLIVVGGWLIVSFLRSRDDG